jgi:hypothetical protein
MIHQNRIKNKSTIQTIDDHIMSLHGYACGSARSISRADRRHILMDESNPPFGLGAAQKHSDWVRSSWSSYAHDDPSLRMQPSGSLQAAKIVLSAVR